MPRHSSLRELPWKETNPSLGHIRSPQNDKINHIFPDLALASQNLKSRQLPLWNPAIFCGVPHAANPLTASFYPPRWVWAALTPINASLASAAFHLLVAGIGLYGFLRVAKLSPSAALVGGTAFLLSGWVGGHLHNTPLVAAVAWIPVTMMGIEGFIRTRNRRWLGSIAMSAGLMGLAGFPQFAVLGGLFLFLFALTRSILLPRPTSLLGITSALLAGLFLSAIQWIPTWEFLEFTERSLVRTPEDMVSERLRPVILLGLLFPNIFGLPSEDHLWRESVLLRLLTGEGPHRIPPNITGWSERTVYVGIVVLILAFFGLGRRANVSCGRTHPLTLSILAPSILLLALGSVPWICSRLSLLPGLSFGAPARVVIVLSFVLPILAALGWDRLHSLSPESLRSRTRIVIGVFFIGLIGCVISTLFAESLTEFFISKAKLLDHPFMQSTPQYQGTQCLQLMRTDLFHVTVFCAALMTLLRRLSRLGSGLSTLLLVGIILVDLGSLFLPQNLPVPKDRLYASTSDIEFLYQHRERGRILRISPTKKQAIQDAHRLFPPNLPMIFGLRDAQGYSSLVPKSILEFFRPIAARTQAAGFTGISQDSAHSPRLDVANVAFLVSATPLPSLEEDLVHSGRLYIYQNKDAFSRCTLVEGPSQDPNRLSRVQGEAEILEETHHSLLIRVCASKDAFLLVSDTWMPGWRAMSMDESRWLDVERVCGCFRGIQVNEGESLIYLEYRPRSFEWGMMVSALGLGLSLFWFLRPGRRAP